MQICYQCHVKNKQVKSVRGVLCPWCSMCALKAQRRKRSDSHERVSEQLVTRSHIKVQYLLLSCCQDAYPSPSHVDNEQRFYHYDFDQQTLCSDGSWIHTSVRWMRVKSRCNEIEREVEPLESPNRSSRSKAVSQSSVSRKQTSE